MKRFAMPSFRIGACRPRKVCKICVVAILMIIFLAFTFVVRKYHEVICKDNDSLVILHNLCDLYHNGTITGNLCPDLCDTKAITYRKCLNFAKGKVSIKVDWNGKTAVLKSKKPAWMSYDSVVYQDPFQGGFVPELDNFVSMVYDSLGFTLEIEDPDFQKSPTILTQMWTEDFSKYTKNSDFKVNSPYRAAAESLWMLMQQDEYVLTRYLQHKTKHIPELYGSCGYFYLLEYAPSGPLLVPHLSKSISIKMGRTWKERAELALGVLDFLKELDTNLPQALHLCDVKGDNFGVSETQKNVIKAIDVDTAFFSSKMLKELEGPNCTKSVDCDFFDCKGLCDLKTGRCTKFRTNNNLQSVCEKVFLDGIHNKFLGLLDGAPTKTRDVLLPVLQECANPPLTDSFHREASAVTFDTIYDLLLNSLSDLEMESST